MFVGDLAAKWPHLFVIKFVYWWRNVCICYRHACRNVGSEKLAGRAVHVFSSCLVCFEELTFLLMFFPKSSLCNKDVIYLAHFNSLLQFFSAPDIFVLTLSSTSLDLP